MYITETYNPFVSVWGFTQRYVQIIGYELTNENAQAFYEHGWENHCQAIAHLKDDVCEGWEYHAECCIAVFVPSILLAIAAYRMWQNCNVPRLAAAPDFQRPIACLAPVRIEPVLEMSWINWKAYLVFLFKMRQI